MWYDFIYKEKDLELENSCSFLDEHDSVKKGKEMYTTRIRRVLAFLLVGVMMNSARTGPISHLFTYFTNWAQWTTLLTACIGVAIAGNPDYSVKNSKSLYALHHLFYSLTMFMQPVVVIVYWGVVHEKHITEMTEKYSHQPQLLESKI